LCNVLWSPGKVCIQCIFVYLYLQLYIGSIGVGQEIEKKGNYSLQSRLQKVLPSTQYNLKVHLPVHFLIYIIKFKFAHIVEVLKLQ